MPHSNSQTTTMAVVGAGSHFRKNLLPALNQVADLNIAGILNRSSESTRRSAEELSLQGLTDLDTLCADSRIDLVYVCTPPATHYDIARRALEAGKHVWIEKTLTTSLAQWQSLVDLATERNLAVFECFMFLHHAQFGEVRRLMQEQPMGPARFINARFGFPHLPKDNFRYNPALGGGGLLDAGCYPLRALGELSAYQLASKGSVLNSEPGFDVDTRGSALFHFDDTNANLEWGMGLDYRNEMEIWFSEGRALIERAFSKPGTIETRIHLHSQKHGDRVITVPPGDHFENMFRQFLLDTRDPDARRLRMSQDLKHARTLFNLLG